MGEKEAVAKINAWCPFCGTDDNGVEKDVNAYHVVCNNCKACGPRELTPAEAIVSWNKAE